MATKASRPVIRVGIIGQGRSGYSIHAAHFATDRKYKIAAVCDLLEERRTNAEQEFGCDSYEDYRDLLK
ncbi:MAG: gfo/Idh/MocA family oxidoreductase, partial [Armatimonadetes bacterium CG_4_10_14_3_um_filter_66_18]